jgi:hypothetical protein
LVEKVATRGDRPALGRALVPASWDVYDYTRSDGSGSMAWWLNPSDQEEMVYTSQGVSKGVWFEADGIEGSITPGVPEGSLIEEISPTVFTYQHLDGDAVRSGVWRATLPLKGEEVCCFYHAWIVLRGPNQDVVTAFIEHQLSQVETLTAASLDPIEFDVENATFDVCISPWRDGGPVSFTDGGWEDEIYDDDPLDDWAGRPGGFAWVTEVAIGELVEESPGPEVLAEIGCSGGGSHTDYEVQVFAGNTSEPRRLGRILYEFVEDHADTELHFKYGSENTITTRNRVWQGYDAHCCPSKYVLTNYKWMDGDWAETRSEAWIMESWMIKAWERESKKAESQ